MHLILLSGGGPFSTACSDRHLIKKGLLSAWFFLFIGQMANVLVRVLHRNRASKRWGLADHVGDLLAELADMVMMTGESRSRPLQIGGLRMPADHSVPSLRPQSQWCGTQSGTKIQQVRLVVGLTPGAIELRHLMHKAGEHVHRARTDLQS